MSEDRHEPWRIGIHPGEILKQEIEGRTMDTGQLAAELAISDEDLAGLLAGEQPVTQEIAGELAKFFHGSPGFWLNTQERYDRFNEEKPSK